MTRANPRRRKKPLIVAHRGSSGSAPENTMAAFELAVAEGADMIELDVRMTRDYHLVVHHDRNVRRTTNGVGNVWDLTLDDLKRLDAGSWYSSRFTGEHIPTLCEVLSFLPATILVNIEVKTDGERRKRLAFGESLILTILEKKVQDRIIVSSFDHGFIKQVHKLHPAIRTGALYVPVRDAVRKPSTLAHRLGCDAFICSRTQLRRRFADDAHAHSIFLGCYTINTGAELKKALRYDVDAVITNYPRRIRQLLHGARLSSD
ncbi:MAG: glycerophosphodiester phosphodiesterase [Ignavibacteriae bacterium]|nr:glycerophosphodiester phosphodiesterase [Ignavibacteriota bacterium]